MQFEGLQGLLKKKKSPQKPSIVGGKGLGNTAETTSSVTGRDVEGDVPPHPLTSSRVGPLLPLPSPKPEHSQAQSSFEGCDGMPTDPYAAALRSVQHRQRQAQQGAESHAESPPSVHKRRRDDLEVEDHTRGTAATVRPGEKQREAAVSPVTSAEIPDETVAPPSMNASLNVAAEVTLRSDASVIAEREKGVAALQLCLNFSGNVWNHQGTRTHSSAVKAISDLEPAQPVTSSFSCTPPAPLPQALRDYLVEHFIFPTSTAARATGLPEMLTVDQEFHLLHAMQDELENSAAKECIEDGAVNGTHSEDPGMLGDHHHRHGAPKERNDLLLLAEISRALWYLIAARWKHSLVPYPQDCQQGSLVGATSTVREGQLSPDQQGWSPLVYQALQNVLPAEARLLQGRAIAEEVDRWRSLTRTRRHALELLAYINSDYESAVAASSASACASLESPTFIVPENLRMQLHSLLVRHLQQERNFMAARQDYVDMTMGTANWKLGLFSGGEVHMRRSMERVERNRIAHLLNNEHATNLLQSVRELTTFAEQEARSPSFQPFFSLASP